MEQELSRIANTYDAVAKEYAGAFSREHDNKPMDQQMLKRFAEQIRSKNPVWDLGCGPGQTAKYLSDLGIKISGMDLCPEIINQAEILFPEITFKKGNILNLDFKGNSIGAIVAFYSIVHFTEKQVMKAIQEIFRVLIHDGVFLFTFHIGSETIHVKEFLGKSIDIDFMFFTTDFIHKCLIDTGFSNIEITEREPYPGVEYESRRAYVFAVKP